MSYDGGISSLASCVRTSLSMRIGIDTLDDTAEDTDPMATRAGFSVSAASARNAPCPSHANRASADVSNASFTVLLMSMPSRCDWKLQGAGAHSLLGVICKHGGQQQPHQIDLSVRVRLGENALK